MSDTEDVATTRKKPGEQQTLNGIDVLLVDLIRMGESPLYSTYRWLGREIGREISLDAFLTMVDRLVTEDVLQLWAIDPGSGERTRHTNVPDELSMAYKNAGALDERFDPFALSLTVGPRLAEDAEPEWDVDFDFSRETFSLRVQTGKEIIALKNLAAFFPDVELVERQRATSAGGRVEVSGVIRLDEGRGVGQTVNRNGV